MRIKCYEAIHENSANRRGGTFLDPFDHVFMCRCIVCRETFRTATDCTSPIFINDVIHLDKIYYIIPQIHQKCRDLFNLNPLAYEKSKTTYTYRLRPSRSIPMPRSYN